MILPSCSKHLLMTFGEVEWEGPLFCGKHCFKHYKKSLKNLTIKTKGGVPWIGWIRQWSVLPVRKVSSLQWPRDAHNTMSLWMLWVIGQTLPPCPSFSMIEVPDNFDTSYADENATNSAVSMHKASPAKRNAEGKLLLHRKPRSSASSISS